MNIEAFLCVLLNNINVVCHYSIVSAFGLFYCIMIYFVECLVCSFSKFK